MDIIKKIVLFLFLFSLGNFCAVASEDVQEDSSPQNIGGLLFDFDEGVAIEEGPGGSVYVKSNKEFMKKKFREIDRKLADLESRLQTLEEKALDELVKSDNGETEQASKVSIGATAEGRRVLST